MGKLGTHVIREHVASGYTFVKAIRVHCFTAAFLEKVLEGKWVIKLLWKF